MKTAVVNKNRSMNAWDFLMEISRKCSGFFSTENPGKKASNSELKRWLQNHSVSINKMVPSWNDLISFPVVDMVIFPKSLCRKMTLADDQHPFILVESK
jgi:hypothetical protein